MPEYKMTGKESPAFEALDAFTKAYIEAAIWTSEEQLAEESESLEMSSTAFVTVNGKPTGETVFVAGNIGFELLAPETLQSMINDCKKFQEENALDLDHAYILQSYDASQAGHDFWLTRNGHGVGFWDRGLDDTGKQLTIACGHGTKFPGVDLYIGDDGKIHS